MNAVLALAGPAAREIVRARSPYAIGAYLVLIGAITPTLARLSMGAPHRAVHDVGLWTAWLLACILAIISGVRAVGPDLRHGAVALWLCRPVSRSAFVLGRFFGTLAALELEIAALTGGFALVTPLGGYGLPDGLPAFGLMLGLEAALLCAMALFLASIVDHVAAGLATAGLWVAGHLVDEYGRLANGAPAMQWIERVLFLFVPDFDRFDVHAAVVHGLPVDPVAVAWSAVYALAWGVAMLALTTASIERRDLA